MGWLLDNCSGRILHKVSNNCTHIVDKSSPAETTWANGRLIFVACSQPSDERQVAKLI